MEAYSYVLGQEVKSDTPAEMVIEPPHSLSFSTKEKIETPSIPMEIIKDDLKRIEGVGPKIESLLNDGGIYSYSDLANARFSK